MQPWPVAVGKVESRQLLEAWEGEVPLGRATLEAGMGPPGETHLSLPASPHHRPHSPRDGGSNLAQSLCNCTARVIIININYYAENCWPNFENLTTF